MILVFQHVSAILFEFSWQTFPDRMGNSDVYYDRIHHQMQPAHRHAQ